MLWNGGLALCYVTETKCGLSLSLKTNRKVRFSNAASDSFTFNFFS